MYIHVYVYHSALSLYGNSSYKSIGNYVSALLAQLCKDDTEAPHLILQCINLKVHFKQKLKKQTRVQFNLRYAGMNSNAGSSTVGGVGVQTGRHITEQKYTGIFNLHVRYEQIGLFEIVVEGEN